MFQLQFASLLDVASCPVLQHMLLLDKEKLYIQHPNLQRERQQDTTLCLADSHVSADSVSYIRVSIFIAISRPGHMHVDVQDYI